MNDKKQKIKLLNPLSEDFSVTYDVNGDAKPVKFTAVALKITTFDELVGNHVRKHLVEQIINVRGWRIYGSWDNARVEIAKEITK